VKTEIENKTNTLARKCAVQMLNCCTHRDVSRVVDVCNVWNNSVKTIERQAAHVASSWQDDWKKAGEELWSQCDSINLLSVIIFVDIQ